VSKFLRITTPIAMGVLALAMATACSSQATPPAATSAPAAAAPAATSAPKAAAPAAATSAPAAAAEKKVDFPTKGKTITMIVPYNPGGNTDTSLRTLSLVLQKEIGTTVEVVNRPGGGAQVGVTELATAKPDGYTLGDITLPTVPSMYLDADRKAAFGRKDLVSLAQLTVDPQVIAVRKESPFQSVKDLVDAAKANPSKVKAATTGVLSVGDFSLSLFQKETGTQLAVVNMDGAAPIITATLGGQVDFCVSSLPNFIAQLKGGDMRILAVMDSQESPFAPGVKTLEAQGYKINMASVGGLATTGGTPAAVQEALRAAIKKAATSSDYTNKMKEVGANVRYTDQAEFDAYWTSMDALVKPLIEQSKKK